MKGNVTTAARRFCDCILTPCLHWLGKLTTIVTVRVPNWVLLLVLIILGIALWRWGPECLHLLGEHLRIDSDESGQTLAQGVSGGQECGKRLLIRMAVR